MSRNKLLELEEIVLCFEEKCESACELVKFDNIIYSKIQDYKGVK